MRDLFELLGERDDSDANEALAALAKIAKAAGCWQETVAQARSIPEVGEIIARYVRPPIGGHRETADLPIGIKPGHKAGDSLPYMNRAVVTCELGDGRTLRWELTGRMKGRLSTNLERYPVDLPEGPFDPVRVEAPRATVTFAFEQPSHITEVPVTMPRVLGHEATRFEHEVAQMGDEHLRELERHARRLVDTAKAELLARTGEAVVAAGLASPGEWEQLAAVITAGKVPMPPPEAELHAHAVDGPAACRRCQMLRDNREWMEAEGKPLPRLYGGECSSCSALRAFVAELLRTLEGWSPHEDGPTLDEVSAYWSRARALGVSDG